jgi:hypothetical protein
MSMRTSGGGRVLSRPAGVIIGSQDRRADFLRLVPRVPLSKGYRDSAGRWSRRISSKLLRVAVLPAPRQRRPRRRVHALFLAPWPRCGMMRGDSFLERGVLGSDPSLRGAVGRPKGRPSLDGLWRRSNPEAEGRPAPSWIASLAMTIGVRLCCIIPRGGDVMARSKQADLLDPERSGRAVPGARGGTHALGALAALPLPPHLPADDAMAPRGGSAPVPPRLRRRDGAPSSPCLSARRSKTAVSY